MILKSVVAGLCFIVLTTAACGTPSEQPGSSAVSTSRINTVGKELPDDAASLDQQYLRLNMIEPSTLDVGISLFDAQFNAFLFEQLVVFDDNLELKPAAAESWSVGEDKKPGRSRYDRAQNGVMAARSPPMILSGRSDV